MTILCALPLAQGGAFVGLLIGQKALSMPSLIGLIGLIMLMGVATKNTILVVEYAIVARRDHGMSRWDALRDACHKRARPIIMTTIAMGAGMLPIAVGFGAADSSFRSPMPVKHPTYVRVPQTGQPANGYLPKGTDLSGYSQAQLDAIADESTAGPARRWAYDPLWPSTGNSCLAVHSPPA